MEIQEMLPINNDMIRSGGAGDGKAKGSSFNDILERASGSDERNAPERMMSSEGGEKSPQVRKDEANNRTAPDVGNEKEERKAAAREPEPAGENPPVSGKVAAEEASAAQQHGADKEMSEDEEKVAAAGAAALAMPLLPLSDPSQATSDESGLSVGAVIAPQPPAGEGENGAAPPVMPPRVTSDEDGASPDFTLAADGQTGNAGNGSSDADVIAGGDVTASKGIETAAAGVAEGEGAPSQKPVVEGMTAQATNEKDATTHASSHQEESDSQKAVAADRAFAKDIATAANGSAATDNTEAADATGRNTGEAGTSAAAMERPRRGMSAEEGGTARVAASEEGGNEKVITAASSNGNAANAEAPPDELNLHPAKNPPAAALGKEHARPEAANEEGLSNGVIATAKGSNQTAQNNGVPQGETTFDEAMVSPVGAEADLKGGGEGKSDNASLGLFAQKGTAAQTGAAAQTEQGEFKIAARAAGALPEADKGITLSRIMSDGLKGEVKINMNPPSLGRLQVELSLQDNQVKAFFVAESHSVKGILENNMQDLKNGLSGREMNLESFDVSTNSRGREGDQASDAEMARWKGRPHERPQAGAEEKSVPSRMTMEWQGLNIFV